MEEVMGLPVELPVAWRQKFFPCRPNRKERMGNDEWAQTAVRRLLRRSARRVAVALAAVRLLGVE